MQIRLIDQTGKSIMMIKSYAEKQAEGLGLDLVRVSKDGKPPVYKMVDKGKMAYEKSKKKKKQKATRLKEIKLSPKIGIHDIEFKLKNARKFLEKRNKVQVSIQFKGREVIYYKDGEQIVRSFIEKLSDISSCGKISKQTKRITAVLDPK